MGPDLGQNCLQMLSADDMSDILMQKVKYNGFDPELSEKIHLDFLKSILKMKSSTPLIMIYGEFGRFPLEIQVKTRMIKFWAKILTGKNTKISYKMYELLLYLHNKDIYSCKWILCIQKILQDVG